MIKYLLDTTVTYRVSTIEDVKRIHEEMQSDPNYSLVAFSYKTKAVKEKGDIVDEYQVITAKLVINAEKDPEDSVTDIYIGDYSTDEGDSFDE